MNLFSFHFKIEEVFTAKTRYVCQTKISDKQLQSVKCKTIEIETDDDKKSSKKPTSKDVDVNNHGRTDDSSEESDEIDFNDKDDEEISSKLISIKQELKLQTGRSANVDGSSLID
jgi:hypothetical protein